MIILQDMGELRQCYFYSDSLKEANEFIKWFNESFPDLSSLFKYNETDDTFFTTYRLSALSDHALVACCDMKTDENLLALKLKWT